MVRRKGEEGTVLLLVALGMIILLSVLGLAIDMGYLRNAKRQLQTAADASAMAGGLEVASCGGITNCNALQNAVQGALSENGFGTSTLVSNSCPAGSVSTLTVYVNNPPMCMPLGSANGQDPHNGDNSAVEVIVANSEPTFFAKVMGVSSVIVSTRAETILGSSPNCVYVLGSPGVTESGSAPVSATCGLVDYSNLSLSGSASMSFTSIGLGGTERTSGSSSVTPTPHTIRTTPVNDPLASLPKPTLATCSGSSISVSGPYTFWAVLIVAASTSRMVR
jgi:hypothetical protein